MPGRNRSQESESTVDLTRRYLSELGSYPLLTAEQEVELAQAIEAGRLAEIELSLHHAQPGPQGRCCRPRSTAAEAARRTFIQSNLRLVVSIAKRYQGTGHDAARPHPGGQPRADAGGREVRPPQGLQVLHLRHVVDPPVHRPGHRRQGAAPSACPPTSSTRWRCSSKASATMLKTLGREPTAGGAGRGDRDDRSSGCELALARRPRPRLALGVDRRRRRRARRPARRRQRRGPRSRSRRCRSPGTTCRTSLDYLNPREREILALRFGLRATSPSRSTRSAAASTSPASASARSRPRRSPSCATRARPGTAASCRSLG